MVKLDTTAFIAMSRTTLEDPGMARSRVWSWKDDLLIL